MKSSSVSHERKELLKNKAFLIYFIASTISWFGNGMQFISTSWLGLTLTGNNYTVAIILICSALPGVLLSPITGVLVDKVNKKVLASILDFFRGVVIIAIPFLWIAGVLNIWHLYLMTFLIAIGDIIYQPTLMAMIREIIPKRLLLTANSTTQIMAQIGTVIGAGVGGVIVAVYSPIWVMVINSLTYFISGLCILFMKYKKHASKKQRIPNIKTKFVEQFVLEFKIGFNYLINNKNIWFIYAIMLTYPITLRVINTLLPIFSKDVLEVGAAGFGYIDSGFALGAIVGGFLLPYIVKKYGVKLTMLGGLGSLALSIILFSVSINLWSAIVAYFLIGCTFQSRITFLTTIQHQVDLEVQGRVHSFYTTFVSIFALLLYGVIGILSEVVSSRILFLLLGVLILISFIFATNTKLINHTKQEKQAL